MMNENDTTKIATINEIEEMLYDMRHALQDQIEYNDEGYDFSDSQREYLQERFNANEDIIKLIQKLK